MNIVRRECHNSVFCKKKWMDGSWYYLWKLYLNQDVQSRVRGCLDRSQMRSLWHIAVESVAIVVVDELWQFNAEDILIIDVLMNKIKK